MGTSTAAKEKRARDRKNLTGRVRIFWCENGIQRQTTGELRDISPTGLSCWVGQRMPSPTVIRLECPVQHLHGDALVRHCNSQGARFLLGIEFRGGLTWRSSDAPVPRPRFD